MSNRAKELQSERARSLRNFRLVLGAFFIGIAIGTYVETHFFMSKAEAAWMWTYSRGKIIVTIDEVSNGAAQNFISNRHEFIPAFRKLAAWMREQVSAVQMIEKKYLSTDKTLRSSLIRILLLWSLLAAALTYTGISVLEARKDG